MWCDNCLLLFPLRGGAIAWAVIIALYSLGGGIFLLRYGEFLFFVYPEWFIYGGISLAVGLVALITVLALANRSYIWTGASVYLWPFLVVLSAIRAIFMIVELQRGQSNILWECNNGGQLWTASAVAGYGGTASFPSTFCSSGFASINAAFIISLLVDIVFQIYMFFLIWRYKTQLENYEGMSGMSGPFYGGYYKP